jgi:hypothetical protein
MNDDQQFDFWYAVQNTHVVKAPSNILETFGNTLVNYHHIAEMMDSTAQIRIREGRVEAVRPQIMTPDHFSSSTLDGFGEESQKYVDWLQANKGDIAILKYGFSIRKLDVNEHIITETLTNAVDRVKKEIDKKADPLAALVVGVDDPWEVSLIKMMVELAGRSAPIHAQQLNLDPHGVIHEIEQAFKAAAENRNLITRLSTLLEKHDMFTEYQDRFFDLVRTNQ